MIEVRCYHCKYFNKKYSICTLKECRFKNKNKKVYKQLAKDAIKFRSEY